MRLSKLITALFFAGLVSTGYVLAADSTQPAPAVETSKLEKISDAPAAIGQGKEECPMAHGKKHMQHKHAEPCPHHQDEMHHGKSHDKCDHQQHG